MKAQHGLCPQAMGPASAPPLASLRHRGAWPVASLLTRGTKPGPWLRRHFAWLAELCLSPSRQREGFERLMAPPAALLGPDQRPALRRLTRIQPHCPSAPSPRWDSSLEQEAWIRVSERLFHQTDHRPRLSRHRPRRRQELFHLLLIAPRSACFFF